MARILAFPARSTSAPATPESAALSQLLDGFSIEVMPRTAARVEDFRALLPTGTRVYLAHIDGTDFADMLATARRLTDEGFVVMPHFPARGIASRCELKSRIEAYADIGVRQALVLAGGIDRPRGPFTESLELLQTSLFDAHGFTHLHIAGHPEGNRDIDPDGSDHHAMAALRRKDAFQRETDASMAIVTQFGFEAAPIVTWAERLSAAGISLPVHIGIAGPAKLQTLIKYAMACGVGASLRVLQRRALDLTRLVQPFEPTDLLRDLARHKAATPGFPIERVHLFPLGGIERAADYVADAVPLPRRARA